MILRALAIFTLIFLSAPVMAQQSTSGLTPRAFYVPQCSTAARVSALLARIYPNDAAKRNEGLISSTNELFQNKHEETPTSTQLNTAFVVMETLLKVRAYESRESLNEIILSEAAATCMAASLSQ